MSRLWYVENLDMHDIAYVVASSAETAKAIARVVIPTPSWVSTWSYIVVQIPLDWMTERLARRG